MNNEEDIILWPCGTWCLAFELAEMSHMSDDFERIPFGSERWDEVAAS